MKTRRLKELSSKLQRDIIKEVPTAVSINYIGAKMQKKQDTLDLIYKELKEFKQEMTEFKHEMTEFKQEMTEFKQEMTQFRQDQLKFNNLLLSLPTIKKEISELQSNK